MRQDATSTKTIAKLGLTLMLAGAAAALPACRGDRSEKPPRRFFPDMDDQPRMQPQMETEFFADNNRNQRLPDDRAVAFGIRSFDPEDHATDAWASEYNNARDDLLKEGETFYYGVLEGSEHSGDNAEFVDYMPVTVTRDLINHGRDKFTIYCTPCHGTLGDGQGSVGVRWSAPPANLLGPNFIDRANRTAKDGYIFHIIRNGLWTPDGLTNRMPAYGHALSERDAWAVVSYLRVLQTSQSQIVDDLPQADQDALNSLPVDPPAAEGGDS